MSRLKNKTSGAVLFKRYLWLVDVISTFGPITLKEINKRWLNSSLNEDSLELPRETFIHHKEAVQTMFDIEILCDTKHQYYIEQESADVENSGIRRWMIDSLSINGILNENKSVKNLILFEESAINSRYVRIIIEAVSEKILLNVTYRKFGAEESHFVVQPLCLKTLNQRWYLVCKIKGRDGVFTLGLERILEIEKTTIAFKPDSKFNPYTHFNDYIGITVDKRVDPELIEIHATQLQADYLRTKPLHRSQQEIGEINGKIIFNYFVAPTYELEMELLRYSMGIEVVSPLWLREKVIERLRGILRGYGKED